jgi:tRNA threonylcarbamoyl adenosine modification protein (Sua5/YciO/YrdC/YwlC family)
LAEVLSIHPETPQRRHIVRAAEAVRRGALRRLEDRHQFTLVFEDLSGSGAYARYDTPAYRLLKSHTPGPYTFILRASREVPRRLQHPKKKTIGLRIPDSVIALELIRELGEPMLTTTLRLPGDDHALTEASDIERRAGFDIDLILDGGPCTMDLTTVVDMTGDVPEVVRRGRGDTTAFD